MVSLSPFPPSWGKAGMGGQRGQPTVVPDPDRASKGWRQGGGFSKSLPPVVGEGWDGGATRTTHRLARVGGHPRGGGRAVVSLSPFPPSWGKAGMGGNADNPPSFPTPIGNPSGGGRAVVSLSPFPPSWGKAGMGGNADNPPSFPTPIGNPGAAGRRPPAKTT